MKTGADKGRIQRSWDSICNRIREATSNMCPVAGELSEVQRRLDPDRDSILPGTVAVRRSRETKLQINAHASTPSQLSETFAAPHATQISTIDQ